MINRTPNERWRVRVKSGGAVVGDKTFDLKRDAENWERDQKLRLGDGSWVDPRRGKTSVQNVIDEWLLHRAVHVSSKTYQTDEYLLRVHTPKSFANRAIGSIEPTDVKSILTGLIAKKLAVSSVRRYRATLSALFTSAVGDRIVRSNPVLAVKTPKGDGTLPVREVYPFSLEALRAVYAIHKATSPSQADVTLFLGLSGLRWGELAALRVRDLHLGNDAYVFVSRSGPDGHEIRTKTKGGGSRSVPLASELLPLVMLRAEGKRADDFLFAAPEGGRMNANNWRRSVSWSTTSRGRRVHDLRHSAATLWLGAGLDVKTVQTWLGHASATLTLDLYSHFMGQDANRAGIARFNAALGDATGTRPKMARKPSVKPRSKSAP